MNDLINRQAAIDVIEKWLECSDYNEAERHIMRATESILYDLPSVNQQEPCEDAISRKALISHIEMQSREWGEDYDAQQILGDIEDMPSVKPQEPSITWVTGADGAKIVLWDVPIWKVTKICEILGEPQERSEE